MIGRAALRNLLYFLKVTRAVKREAKFIYTEDIYEVAKGYTVI